MSIMNDAKLKLAAPDNSEIYISCYKDQQARYLRPLIYNIFTLKDGTGNLEYEYRIWRLSRNNNLKTWDFWLNVDSVFENESQETFERVCSSYNH